MSGCLYSVYKNGKNIILCGTGFVNLVQKKKLTDKIIVKFPSGETGGLFWRFQGNQRRAKAYGTGMC